MKIRVLTVGTTRTQHWQAAEREYAARIGRYADFSQDFVREADLKSLRNDELAKQQEAKHLQKKLVTDELFIALDAGGKPISSETFADYFSQNALQGRSRFVFVIGGPVGLDGEFLRCADFVLSLSRMTLPHELAKVVLLEQIYRAMTILRGEKYHK